MIFPLLTALVVSSLPACGPLDLDTALALSLERSNEVAIAQDEVAAARTDEALARALRVLPIGSATYVMGPAPAAHGTVTQASGSTNRSLTGLRPFGRIDLNVVQPLYTWGRLDAAEEAATAGVRARRDLVDDAAEQVQIRVAQLYWGVALADRLLGLADEVKKALAQASDQLQRMEKEGSTDVGPADRYRLELFKSAIDVRRADAERAAEEARMALAASLGTTPERLQLRRESLDFPQAPVPVRTVALAIAERQRPDLLALSAGIEASEADVKAERAAKLPQFFALGTFTYSYAPNRTIQLNPWVTDPFNTLELGAVVGLKQDLSFPTLDARAEKAAAERDTLERQRRALLTLVQVQVDWALSDLKAANARYSASQQALGSGRSLFRSVSLDFAAGVIEAKTLIEAYGMYVESQLTAAQAAYDLAVARAHYRQVIGEAPLRDPPCELY